MFFIVVLQNPGFRLLLVFLLNVLNRSNFRFPFTPAHLFLGYQLIKVLSMAFNEKVFFIIIYGLCQMKTKGNKTFRNFVFQIRIHMLNLPGIRIPIKRILKNLKLLI